MPPAPPDVWLLIVQHYIATLPTFQNHLVPHALTSLLTISLTCRALRACVLQSLLGFLRVPASHTTWFLSVPTPVLFSRTHTATLTITLDDRLESYFAIISGAFTNLVSLSLVTCMREENSEHACWSRFIYDPRQVSVFLANVASLTDSLPDLQRLAITLHLPKDGEEQDLTALGSIASTSLRQLALIVGGPRLHSTSHTLPRAIVHLHLSLPAFLLYFAGDDHLPAPLTQELRIDNPGPIPTSWIPNAYTPGAPVWDFPVLPWTMHDPTAFSSAILRSATLEHLTVLSIHGFRVSYSMALHLRHFRQLHRLDFHPAAWADWPVDAPFEDSDVDDYEENSALDLTEIDEDSRLAPNPIESACIALFLRAVGLDLASLQLLHIGGAHALVSYNTRRAQAFWHDLWSSCGLHPNLVVLGIGICRDPLSCHRHFQPCATCRSPTGFQPQCHSRGRTQNDTPRIAWQSARLLCIGHFRQMCSVSPFLWSYSSEGFMPGRS